MVYEHILFDVSSGVATLTINRPKLLNALSMQTLAEMADAVDRARDGDEARALLITGAGPAFSSGADLSASAADSRLLNDRGAGLEIGFNPLMERLMRLPIPYVAAINGVLAGGAVGLALAADIVIAGRSAYLLQPFARIGLVPDVGATWLLPRLAGRGRAMAMMMLGERLPAEQARDWGLIHDVVDDEAVLDTAQAMASRLAIGPTATYALMKQAVLSASHQTFTEALAGERELQRAAGRTADHIEGVTAFLQKRPPNFSGT
jgi:2-(1,2-epoxy-1,2-dihydrophenyl)acetyl-CoA isomerase